ncbi:hypothetical protein EDD85DRAFT_777476 [Armillaria nabsnona]|nr:hypothetical protein EDD85DRAFT_777476 [Armillaria nabsnona]
MQFLWVCWYAFDSSVPSRFKVKHLPCLGFLPGDDSLVFGFVDPEHILHACHIMPVYHSGLMPDILAPSISCRFNEKHIDWIQYYMNMCVNLNSCC